MTDATEQFKRYAQEHARLYDPVVLDAGVELVPVHPSPPSDRAVKGRHKAKRKGERPIPPSQSRLEPNVERDGTVVAKETQRGSDDRPSFEEIARTLRSVILERQGQQTPGAEAAAAEVSQRIPEPKGKPRIAIQPQTVKWDVPLFDDQSFQVHAPGAEKVSLVWQPSGNSELNRVVMDHRTGGGFLEATVGIPDGDYLFAYEVDGYRRLDARYSQRIVIRRDGIFAPMRLSRCSHALVIRNLGDDAEIVRLAWTAPWIATQGDVIAPARGETETVIRILPQQMSQGKNVGTLTASVRRRGNEMTVAVVNLEVNLKPNGAVPVIRCEPSEFGWVLQGRDTLQFEVEVAAQGIGPLTGMLFLPHPGQAADFQIEAGDGASTFKQSFTINSLDLPHRTEGVLKITLVNDCYLANHRLIEMLLPYRLVYLKKSLPALAYGKVRQGQARTLRLEVERSDGQEVDLAAVVPESARRYLQAFRAKPDAYSFMFDTRALRAGEAINQVVTIEDRLSGLRDQVKVVAEVVANDIGTAQIAAGSAGVSPA